jgi:hypothetical protein
MCIPWDKTFLSVPYILTSWHWVYTMMGTFRIKVSWKNNQWIPGTDNRKTFSNILTHVMSWGIRNALYQCNIWKFQRKLVLSNDQQGISWNIRGVANCRKGTISTSRVNANLFPLVFKCIITFHFFENTIKTAKCSNFKVDVRRPEDHNFDFILLNCSKCIVLHLQNDCSCLNFMEKSLTSNIIKSTTIVFPYTAPCPYQIKMYLESPYQSTVAKYIHICNALSSLTLSMAIWFAHRIFTQTIHFPLVTLICSCIIHVL